MARMQAKEVVDVAMVVVGVIDVTAPLHQLSVAANRVGSQISQDIFPTGAFLFVALQQA